MELKSVVIINMIHECENVIHNKIVDVDMQIMWLDSLYYNHYQLQIKILYNNKFIQYYFI